MFLTILVVVAMCAKFSMDFSKKRVLPSDFYSISGTIDQARAEVSELSAIDPLPSVQSSWGVIKATGQIYGFEVSAYSQAESQSIALYSGPLKSWHASLKGNPAVVISALKQLQKEVPVFLFDYAIQDDRMVVNFSVVGT